MLPIRVLYMELALLAAGDGPVSHQYAAAVHGGHDGLAHGAGPDLTLGALQLLQELSTVLGTVRSSYNIVAGLSIL